jgi:RecB family exonuclease
VPDLRALQRVVVEACGPESRRTAVLVPTRSAAAELRRTIENVWLLDRRAAAVLLPDLHTRDDFYRRLAERLPGSPRLLSGFEREVLFRLSARAAEAAGAAAPFTLRPGLVVEILEFYDQLRRNHRTVDHFHRLLSAELAAVADVDAGAERLLRQAEFLAAAFGELEARTARAGGVDEHGLRALLLEKAATPPYARVIVTVADQASDAHGLWPSDFDLLARMPGLAAVDVVATERVLAAGFHQRLVEQHLPGIEEQREGIEGPPPALRVPASSASTVATHVHRHRDREEEIASIARDAKLASGTPLERTAVVFNRPLPYLYLARDVFGAAHVPYQTVDAFPLAAEPFAAALDLVLSFVASEGTRASAVALLGSPHWRFADPSGEPLTARDAAALDSFLRELKYLGGRDRLESLVSNPPDSASARQALPALRAAGAVARGLAPVTDARRASEQVAALQQFVLRHERVPAQSDPWRLRHLRARAALLAGLDGLRLAHEWHDDEPLAFVELAAAIRRWVEAQTFAPRTGASGLLLLDAAAAAFADVDAIRLVGLVHGDWPERAGKSIFFPARVLEPLGWPQPADRLAGSRARFHDLLRLPLREVSASLFSLEDDAIVAASAFVEEVVVAGLPAIQEEPRNTRVRVFDHEGLSMSPTAAPALGSDAAEWLAFREGLAPAASAEFHGRVGSRAPGVYAASRVERYLECPFKYFAAHVLRLDEEREEESGLSAQERGQFLHAVFEHFYRRWSEAGRGAVTAETLEDALALFREVAAEHLDALRPADRELERTHLLGSAVAPGLAERAFAFEIEQGTPVIDRLLEHEIAGTFVFDAADGPRPVAVRAKADRIDLLPDGAFRVIDYKTGRAPRGARAVQLSVYSVCVRGSLADRLGGDPHVAAAGYIAFREKNPFVSVGQPLQKALAEGEARFVEAVTAIEGGEFPPRPEDPWLCSRCGFPTVCRKDYVGDD